METEEIYIDSPQPPARPKRVIWPYAVAAGVLAAGGLALWWSKAPAPEVQSVPAPVYTQPLKVPATRPASEASPGRSAGPSADKSPAPAKPVTKAESVAPTTSEEVVADPFVRTVNAPTPSSSVVAAPPSTLPGSTPRRADLNAQPALPIQRPVQHVTAPVQVVPAPDMPVIQIQPPRPVTPAELVQAAPSPSVVPAERSTERALPPISVVPRIRIQPPDAPASPTATPKVTPPPISPPVISPLNRWLTDNAISYAGLASSGESSTAVFNTAYGPTFADVDQVIPDTEIRVLKASKTEVTLALGTEKQTLKLNP